MALMRAASLRPPGRHCNVLLVVRTGDLVLPDEEQIGTFYRHLDPKTSSKLHEEEAANVLRFFGEAVKAELNHEEEEDEEREDDDVMVTGEEEAVQFTGEKVADKSSGSGPKSGKKAWGSGGSTTTRMASKAAIERMKAAERENKKLREEKLVAEKRLEFQTARMDTLFGVVTSALNKLTTDADSMTSHE
ncbi:unnamed protein product [Closterium sp. NIES-64]|nr:unnamed protein product [Closterium sp. NIES-64]